MLLDHYSNRDITDHLDRLPRDTAQERMHHDIVRLLDQYNLVHSPHAGPPHLGGGGGGGHSMVCDGAGGFMGMRPGPQGKKNRRGANAKVTGAGAGAGGGAKELKDMKAKRRKKPAGGEVPNGGAAVPVGAGGGAAGGGAVGGANAAAASTAAGNVKGPGLSESSVTMSPVDSLESPHSYAGDVAAASGAATSPPLLSSPTSRQLLPPVSHMLASQQQSWVGLGKHGGYGGASMFATMPHPMGTSHHGMSQHHSPGLLTPMNITMTREQLPPIVTFQMMPGGGQALLKQPQMQGQMQGQGQGHPQQSSAHLHCTQMYPMPDVGLSHGMAHALSHAHSHSHSHSHNHSMGMGMVEGQGRQLPPYQPLQSPVDKYPTPPSQHSYATSGSEGTTPGHPAQPPSEHPYLTPSPESPDPWSSSSPHSNSDWSDVTTSPTPLGNAHAPPCHTHIPEQAQLQPPAQPQTPQAQQPQRSSVYA